MASGLKELQSKGQERHGHQWAERGGLWELRSQLSSPGMQSKKVSERQCLFLATPNKHQRKKSGQMASWSMVTAQHYKRAISHPGPG